MSLTPPAMISPGALLRQPLDQPIKARADLNGFGGFHGGLTLGLLISAMQAEADGITLRSATARFHRPVDDDFHMEVVRGRIGRSVTAITASAVGAKGVLIEASAMFETPAEDLGPLIEAPAASSWPVIEPPAPDAPPPEDLEIFTVPPEFVPISAHWEIRPVGPNRPYAGGREPELTAWIRLLEDDEPPDVHRFVLLMDALAPSYAAVLSTLTLVPTLELTVRPSTNLAMARSPWILLQASTTAADARGWSEERIDAWGLDGEHLGSAHQLRIVRGNKPT